MGAGTYQHRLWLIWCAVHPSKGKRSKLLYFKLNWTLMEFFLIMVFVGTRKLLTITQERVKWEKELKAEWSFDFSEPIGDFCWSLGCRGWHIPKGPPGGAAGHLTFQTLGWGRISGNRSLSPGHCGQAEEPAWLGSGSDLSVTRCSNARSCRLLPDPYPKD